MDVSSNLIIKWKSQDIDIIAFYFILNFANIKYQISKYKKLPKWSSPTASCASASPQYLGGDEDDLLEEDQDHQHLGLVKHRKSKLENKYLALHREDIISVDLQKITFSMVGEFSLLFRLRSDWMVSGLPYILMFSSSGTEFWWIWWSKHWED